MTYQRTIAYLISSLLAVSFYTHLVIQKYLEGSFDSITIPSFWGRAILFILGVQIVLSIITSILVSIFRAISQKEKEEISLSDERNLIIGLKANRISYSVFGVGFLVAMITLAVGLPPLVMLNLIVFSLFGAGIVGFVTQLYLYRRGY